MPFATREGQRDYQRRWIARRRAEFFADKRCDWCGESEQLELHHRDTSKKEHHAIWSWSAARRLAEIAKCVVLCRPCHKRAHADAVRVEAELRNPWTYPAYQRGCRCLLCRAAKREYERDRKGRRREREPVYLEAA